VRPSQARAGTASSTPGHLLGSGRVRSGPAWGITSSRLVILWNEQTHRWTVETEPVKLKVGASSVDIRLDRIINVQGGGVQR
jgi:hypothetical protein